ncbi:MAG: folate family ECF transporter S component [Clostridiales bacterium]|jgi:ECF transporter S component (folate family)|nr:folate family ECF transporter S component [Clostridiales bacterium]
MNKQKKRFPLAQQEIAPFNGTPANNVGVIGGREDYCGATACTATAENTKKDVEINEKSPPRDGVSAQKKADNSQEESDVSGIKYTREKSNVQEAKYAQEKFGGGETKSKIETAKISPPNAAKKNGVENPTAGKRKRTTLRLAYTAVFIALSATMNIAAITGPSNSVSFTYFVNFFAGMLLGPVSGFSVGFLGDLLGCIVSPKGPYIILIGISSGLLGLIPGLIMNLKVLTRLGERFGGGRRFIKAAQILVSMALSALICTAGLNTLATFLIYSKAEHTFSNWIAYMSVRVPSQLPIVAANTLIILPLYFSLESDLLKIRGKISRGERKF